MTLSQSDSKRHLLKSAIKHNLRYRSPISSSSCFLMSFSRVVFQFSFIYSKCLLHDIGIWEQKVSLKCVDLQFPLWAYLGEIPHRREER
jgi:hypothetical protein